MSLPRIWHAPSFSRNAIGAFYTRERFEEGKARIIVAGRQAVNPSGRSCLLANYEYLAMPAFISRIFSLSSRAAGLSSSPPSLLGRRERHMHVLPCKMYDSHLVQTCLGGRECMCVSRPCVQTAVPSSWQELQLHGLFPQSTRAHGPCTNERTNQNQ